VARIQNAHQERLATSGLKEEPVRVDEAIAESTTTASSTTVPTPTDSLAPRAIAPELPSPSVILTSSSMTSTPDATSVPQASPSIEPEVTGSGAEWRAVEDAMKTLKDDSIPSCAERSVTHLIAYFALLKPDLAATWIPVPSDLGKEFDNLIGHMKEEGYDRDIENLQVQFGFSLFIFVILFVIFPSLYFVGGSAKDCGRLVEVQ
jgi:hypothetical protein